jgi:queuine tRNA-ribosyltransferase
MLGPILLTLHNLHYYQELMAGIRGAIEGDALDTFAEDFRRQQVLGDLPAL